MSEIKDGIDSGLTEVTRSSTIQFKSPTIVSTPKRERKKRTAAGNKQSAAWFDAAVKAFGDAAKELALDLDVDAGFLSRMRAGLKPVALRHLLPFLGHREAVLAFCKPLLDSVGMTAIAKPKMSAVDARARVTNAVRKVTALWPVVRDMAASESGMDGDDIEAALDQDSVAATK